MRKDNDENILIPPDEVDRRKEEVKTKPIPIPKHSGQLPLRENRTETSNTRSDEKYVNFGDMVRIELESGGRFGNPAVVYFHDYTTEDVNNIVTSRPDDLMETIINVLNKRKDESATGSPFDVGDFTLEEFYEVLISMKAQFDTVNHIHRWFHSCQDDLMDRDKKPSKQEINLAEIKYTSIENLDEEIRESYKEAFKDPEYFKQYFAGKYKSEPDRTPEEELERIAIREPIIIIDRQSNDEYHFSFIRMHHLIDSYRAVKNEFDPLLRITKTKPFRHLKPDEAKAQREKEIEEIEIRKAKSALEYAQAYTLISLNGNERIAPADKVRIYRAMKRPEMKKLMNMWDRCKCGVDHEMDFVCSICGDVERRSLRRIFSPLELLPFSGDNELDAKGRLQKHPGIDIFFG